MTNAQRNFIMSVLAEYADEIKSEYTGRTKNGEQYLIGDAQERLDRVQDALRLLYTPETLQTFDPEL